MTPTKDASYLDYLRGRPFLVIEVWGRPDERVRTERKDWHSVTGNMVVTDRPRVVQRISPSTLRYAMVIIDVLNDKVIKNRYKSDGTAFDDEILKRCKDKYRDVFARSQFNG